ncbi:mitochondrial ribosomal protein S15 [Volvox carteri f. nagariensis]|uniref:Small ribosomal subunit protein uS15c n=1 Tax=Volvox carteri f. nagariensis TaxID=3068 RepID=D8UD60_VOLCA|nr:mitochondrial ribosomal protein S15 [Volvox carteri f. nagariensis]EFJ42375.1 mitochondrial ribosomal protein S15 [Volvox carteri f. nagariensis]|eukprot:XP_002956608.1 mitochondrial ribosomal protein S15 [Volvox carteri f. nagariensis]
MMALWLVGRLVSGLGVSSKTAVFSLTRQATCDGATPIPLLCLAGSTLQRWPDGHDGLRWTLTLAPTNPSSYTNTAAAALPAFDRAPVTAQPHLKLPVSLDGRCGPCSGLHSVAWNAAFSTSNGSMPAAAAAVAARTPTAAAATDSSASASSDDSGVAAGAGSGQDVAAHREAKPDLVEKFLSLDVCSSGVRRQAERQEVLREFQRHPADTGSPSVMVALWTHRVRSLVRVFDSGRKQLPSIRQLEMLVNRRRRMLTWLRRTDFESYSYTISKLGLRDIYVPAGGEHRYREGLTVNDPVDDQINRLRFNFHTKYRQGKTSMWYRLRPKLIAEDPVLQAADAAAAVEDRQQRQQRREVAAQQRIAAEREQQQQQQQRK